MVGYAITAQEKHRALTGLHVATIALLTAARFAAFVHFKVPGPILSNAIAPLIVFVIIVNLLHNRVTVLVVVQLFIFFVVVFVVLHCGTSNRNVHVPWTRFFFVVVTVEPARVCHSATNMIIRST
jgi:hypothetical protein